MADAEAASGAAPKLLAQRRFLPLFLVQALGAFNDNVFKIALVTLFTFGLADAAGIAIATLSAIASGVFILPFALFAPVAGQIADRVDKAGMMRAVKLLEIVLMCLAAVAYHVQDLTFLFVVLFLMGAQSALFSPIKYGVLPQYLANHELIRGNGLIQAATFAAILAGTILGAQLVVLAGGVTIVSTTVIAVAAIGYGASLYAPPAPSLLPPPPPGETRWTGVWAENRRLWAERRPIFAGLAALALAVAAVLWASGVIGGAAALWAGGSAAALLAALHLLWPSIEDSLNAGRAEPRAWRAILSISWFWFVGVTYLTLLPALAKEQLGGNEDVFTLLLAAFSIGVAIGAVICGAIYRGAVKVGIAPWGAVGIAVFSVDLSFALMGAPTPAPGAPLLTPGDVMQSAAGVRVFADFVALAICAGIYITPLNAVYQSAAPEEMRGRVVACSNLVDSFFMTLSSGVVLVMTGPLALSPQATLSIIGATGFVAAAAVARRAPETRLGRIVLTFWPASIE